VIQKEKEIKIRFSHNRSFASLLSSPLERETKRPIFHPCSFLLQTKTTVSLAKEPSTVSFFLLDVPPIHRMCVKKGSV
jgi:hypothetical protein